MTPNDLDTMSDSTISTPSALYGAWQSTEAFGNTSLDWSQALKDHKANLVVVFRDDGLYSFRMRTSDPEATDVTADFRHIVAADGEYTMDGNQIHIRGDTSGISWTFQPEEDNTMRIRLEGAKRFGRCKGVDVIFFTRATSQSER